MLADLRSKNLNTDPGGRGRSVRGEPSGHASSEDAVVVISSDSDIEIGQFAHSNYRYRTLRRLIITIIQLATIVLLLPLNLAS